MKKRNQLLALCALVVLVLTVFACENPFIPGKYKEPAPPQAPSISVEASPIGPYVKGEGVTMTAKASVGDGGELSYQWYSNTKNSSSGGTKISGAAGESYRPSTNIEDSALVDTTYYYVQVTNTLYGRTTPASSRTVDITAYDTEGRTAIREVSVDVNIPLEGDVPSQTAFVDGSGYACTGIAWTPQHNPFRGNIKYTARITLEALSEHTLIALRSATVNGQAVKFKYDPYASGKDEVELEYTFSEVKTVAEITIHSPTTKMAYTHGDELNLSGLVVRLTYNTGEIEDVALSSFASRNITTVPAHNSTLSHTNHDGKPVVISFAGLTAETANLTVSKAVIATPDVTVVGPATTGVPDLSASVDSAENFISSQVTWIAGGVTFTGSQFAGGTAYTARVTLTVKSGDFVFAQGNALTAKINGFNAVVSNNTQEAITISHTFNSTTTAAIASITIVTQPTKTNYVHGETLDLAGLVVRLNYEGGGTPDDVAFANFEEYNISTVPIQGAVLRRSLMNNEPVVVSCGAKNRNTDELTIGRKTLTVTGASHTKQYDGNQNATGVSDLIFNGRVTVNNVTEIINYDVNMVTGTYVNKNAGTVGMSVTAVELTAGDSATNYTVTVPSANFNVTGGITQKHITITGATHTKPYDGTTTATGVSNLVFSGNVDTVTFDSVSAAYTNANVGSTMRVTGITLTGDSNTNYTVTLPITNISVTGGITKINLTSAVFPGWATVAPGQTLASAVFHSANTYGDAVGGKGLNGEFVSGTFVYNSPNTTPTSGNNYDTTFVSQNYNDFSPAQASLGWRSIVCYVRYDSTTTGMRLVRLKNRWAYLGISTNTQPNNNRRVQVDTPYYMAQYEVTQAQYQTVMGTNPSLFTTGADAGETQNRRPVENVTWFDAIEFCNKLSASDGLQQAYTITGRTPSTGYPITNATVTVDWTKNGYRLPTELEWEHAVRGELVYWAYWWAGMAGVSPTNAESTYYAWFSYNSNSKTHQVGLKAGDDGANPSLYDVAGNVAEWVWDWYGTIPTDMSNNFDWRGAASGTNKITRGGSWTSALSGLNSATRTQVTPGTRNNTTGFRVVRNAQ